MREVSTDGLLERCRTALGDDGLDCFEACIDPLVTAYARSADPELARLLVLVRHAAGDVAVRRGSPSTPRTHWPTTPAPVHEGPLSTEAIVGGIRTHGYVHVPGLLDADQVAELRDDVDRAIEARKTAGREGSTWYERDPYGNNAGRVFAEQGSGLLMSDSPPLLDAILRSHEELGVTAAATDYLGERPAISVMKSQVRKIVRTEPAPWHQDGAFLPGIERSLNLWITLSDCGSTAAGLDVVPCRLGDVLPTGRVGAHFEWSVDPDTVDRAALEVGIVTPEFSAGDGLFFDHLFLHRTSGSATTTMPRYAIETWYFAPGEYPTGQVPILV